MTFNEGSWTKLFQAGTGGGQGLTWALCSCACMHHEGVANPERIPSLRTMGNLDGLTVNCNHHGWSFTYCTSTNKWLDVLALQGLHAHWHGLWGGQPVRIVISWSKVANIIDVAEHERHGTEATKAAASRPQVLTVSSFISLNVQERKAFINLDSSMWALRCICCLAVTCDEESMGDRRSSWRTWGTLHTIWSRGTIQTTGTWLAWQTWISFAPSCTIKARESIASRISWRANWTW